ncbi:MAG TPA: S41 family peptidase [Gemmatimonadales bacterium]|nr:S41 family peptidase [Gemmatimonadales bacterium]
MSKRTRILCALLLPFLLLGALTVRTPARHARWVREYEATQRYLATADANFDWVVRKRGLDLPALDRETRRRIDDAWSSPMAAIAVRGFVWRFADGHTWARIRPGIWWRGMRGESLADAAMPAGASASTDDPPGPVLHDSLSPAEACGVAGLDLAARPEGWGLPFAEVSGAESFPDEEFPAVLMPLADGQKVGIVRIATFGHEHFGPSCARAWERIRARYPATGPGGPRWDLVAATIASASARVAEVANALAQRGAVAVVADITGNGGGSELADATARALTAVPLRIAPGGFIRHPLHQRALDEQRSVILQDTAVASLAQRRLMDRAVIRIDSLRQEAARECDRMAVWTGDAPACSNTVVAPPLIDYAPPGTFAGLADAWALYGPAWYDAPEGAYAGPLLILQDGRSASASEEFAARLRDNGAARIIGAPSYGAGCGYSDGGTRLELPALGLLIRAPDCQRLRMDGSNETEGIRPDVDAGWGPDDTPRVRVEKALSAVARTLADAPR